LTMRRMMLVVAIVGILLASFEAGRRWERASSSTTVGMTIPSQTYRFDDVGPPVFDDFGTTESAATRPVIGDR
jgi:hypothetical protein